MESDKDKLVTKMQTNERIRIFSTVEYFEACFLYAATEGRPRTDVPCGAVLPSRGVKTEKLVASSDASGTYRIEVGDTLFDLPFRLTVDQEEYVVEVELTADDLAAAHHASLESSGSIADEAADERFIDEVLVEIFLGIFVHETLEKQALYGKQYGIRVEVV